MHYVLNGRAGRRGVRALIVLVVLVGVVVLLQYFYMSPAKAPAPVKNLASQKVVQPSPKPADGITSHMLFVGDVFWGRGVQYRAEKSGESYKYLTSGLSAQDRANYDAWIANFECPITTRDVPYQQQVDSLRFNCRPEYLPNLANWFTAASQANNHTANNGGQWGIEQTRQNLQKAGIQYFGNYDNNLNDICEVITVPATTTTTHKTVQLPVALCGYMYVVDVTPTAAQLAVMQKYSKVMPVIAMPHMGVEYRPTAEPAKVSAYRRMIDNGADIVIGAHPHVIQNSEVYKGRLIAYSVGNLLFDQQSVGRPETLGLGVGVRLTIDDSKAADIYESIAPSCKAYKDDCLAQLTAKLETRPKIDVSYNFACYDEASDVPEICSPAAKAEADKAATIDKLSGLATSW